MRHYYGEIWNETNNSLMYYTKISSEFSVTSEDA